MKRAFETTQPAIFAIELHTHQPERLAHFYQDLLGIKFTETDYPFRRYLSELGRVALIISDASGHSPDSLTEGGRITISLLAPFHSLDESHRYFLHPKRPLAGEFPERHASRLRDPDGNYVAVANSLEAVLGKVPPISSWSGLMNATKELVSASLYRLQVRIRALIASFFDRMEYLTNRPTYIVRDLARYTHIVGSREGLFAVNATSYKRLLRGHFFGVTVKDNAVYCFQSCGLNNVGSNGRVIKLTIQNQRIQTFEVIVKGLDDGCHQIDFIGDHLMVVDCYNGRLLQILPGHKGYREHYPLGRLGRDTAMNDYHINSIAACRDGTIWILLHNSNRRPSEVIVLNDEFIRIRRFSLDAGSAHNIVFTNDESEYLVADSRGGRIITATGCVVGGDLMMPRGISLDNKMCVIGDSFFATRPFRKYVPGRIHFYDRITWSRKASVSLPAAPTDIRRIDGRDSSLSNYVTNDTSASSTHSLERDIPVG